MAMIFGIFVMVDQIFSSATFEATASLTQNATTKTFRIRLDTTYKGRTTLVLNLPLEGARSNG